jgi:hypothetical protein
MSDEQFNQAVYGWCGGDLRERILFLFALASLLRLASSLIPLPQV